MDGPMRLADLGRFLLGADCEPGSTLWTITSDALCCPSRPRLDSTQGRNLQLPNAFCVFLAGHEPEPTRTEAGLIP